MIFYDRGYYRVRGRMRVSRTRIEFDTWYMMNV